MALNPNIILGGQGVNVLGAVDAGTVAGLRAYGARRQRQMHNVLAQHGGGLISGDQNAMNAMAAFDPGMVMDVQNVQSSIADRDRRFDFAQSEAGRSQANTDRSYGLQREELNMRRAEIAARTEETLRERQAELDEEQLNREIEADRQAANQLSLIRTREEYENLAPAIFESIGEEVPAWEELETAIVALEGGVEGALRFRAGTADPETSYIVTGEDAAELGLDPERSYNITSGPGGISATSIGGGGQTFNLGGDGDVVDGAGPEFWKKIDSDQGAMFSTLLESGSAVPSRLAAIDQLESILANSDTPEGMEASVKAFAGNYGIVTEGLSSLQAAEAIISRLVPQQRPPGSGPMSDADLELFKRSLPRLVNTREGNMMIMRTLRGIASYEQQQAAIASKVANREITPAQGRSALMALQNPLEQFRREGPTQIGGGFEITPDLQAEIDRWADE